MRDRADHLLRCGLLHFAMELLRVQAGFTSAGTPPDIVSLLDREVDATMTGANVKEQMNALGLEPHRATPESFGETIRRDFGPWGRLARNIDDKPL